MRAENLVCSDSGFRDVFKFSCLPMKLPASRLKFVRPALVVLLSRTPFYR